MHRGSVGSVSWEVSKLVGGGVSEKVSTGQPAVWNLEERMMREVSSAARGSASSSLRLEQEQGLAALN